MYTSGWREKLLSAGYKDSDLVDGSEVVTISDSYASASAPGTTWHENAYMAHVPPNFKGHLVPRERQDNSIPVNERIYARGDVVEIELQATPSGSVIALVTAIRRPFNDWKDCRRDQLVPSGIYLLSPLGPPQGISLTCDGTRSRKLEQDVYHLRRLRVAEVTVCVLALPSGGRQINLMAPRKSARHTGLGSHQPNCEIQKLENRSQLARAAREDWFSGSVITRNSATDLIGEIHRFRDWKLMHAHRLILYFLPPGTHLRPHRPAQAGTAYPHPHGWPLRLVRDQEEGSGRVRPDRLGTDHHPIGSSETSVTSETSPEALF